MRYYLLTFNKNHGDEHNVPALQLYDLSLCNIFDLYGWNDDEI